jgi:hypothetical protein
MIWYSVAQRTAIRKGLISLAMEAMIQRLLILTILISMISHEGLWKVYGSIASLD